MLPDLSTSSWLPKLGAVLFLAGLGCKGAAEHAGAPPWLSLLGYGLMAAGVGGFGSARQNNRSSEQVGAGPKAGS